MTFAARAKAAKFGSCSFVSNISAPGSEPVLYEAAAPECFVLEQESVEFPVARHLCDQAARGGVFPPQGPRLSEGQSLESFRVVGPVVRFMRCVPCSWTEWLCAGPVYSAYCAACG